MGADADNDDIPEFKKDCAGQLTPEQRKISDTAKDIAETGPGDLPPIDPESPAIPAQHLSLIHI